MTDPNTIVASTGAALVTLATVSIGPLLGEYIIIIALGLLGTLVALSEENLPDIKHSIFFVAKGVIFSFIFTGIITTTLLFFAPAGITLTPYAILGAVSFTIGWTSNRLGSLKDWLLSFITGLQRTNTGNPPTSNPGSNQGGQSGQGNQGGQGSVKPDDPDDAN